MRVPQFDLLFPVTSVIGQAVSMLGFVTKRKNLQAAALLMRRRRTTMSCLFKHRWIYDLRFFHVYRKCQLCNLVQRQVWNKDSVYTAWEHIRERTYIESEQRHIVQKHSPGLVRLAHSLGLLRTRASDRTRSLARSA